MKKWIFIILLLPVLVWSDTLKVDYGYGVAGRAGYELDSAMLLDYHGYSVDTLLDTIYVDATTIDTFVVITGTGYHRVVLYGIYAGYPNEWYEVKSWQMPLTMRSLSSGQYACTLLALDTIFATDSFRSNVNFDINMASGEDWMNPSIGAGDTSLIITLDSGSYLWSASSHRQVWTSKTLNVTGAMTDTIFGYSTYTFASLAAPADTNFCVVYGIVRELGSGTAVKNAKITITPPKVNENTCDSTYFAMPKVINLTSGPWQGYEDGYFADTLLKCACMEDTTFVYKIRIEKSGTVIQEFEFNIPRDSSTYLLTPFSGD